MVGRHRRGRSGAYAPRHHKFKVSITIQWLSRPGGEGAPRVASIPNVALATPTVPPATLTNPSFYARWRFLNYSEIRQMKTKNYGVPESK